MSSREEIVRRFHQLLAGEISPAEYGDALVINGYCIEISQFTVNGLRAKEATLRGPAWLIWLQGKWVKLQIAFYSAM